VVVAKRRPPVEAARMTAPRRGARGEGGMQEIFFEILAPLRGAILLWICSGGFRFAATTGYYLPALQADAH
jgi:hypothetical protein